MVRAATPLRPRLGGGGGGGGALCFDATTNLGSWGNHSPQSEANIQASMVRGKWRIAFLATPDIAAGEELQYSILLKWRRQDERQSEEEEEEEEFDVQGGGISLIFMSTVLLYILINYRIQTNEQQPLNTKHHYLGSNKGTRGDSKGNHGATHSRQRWQEHGPFVCKGNSEQESWYTGPVTQNFVVLTPAATGRQMNATSKH